MSSSNDAGYSRGILRPTRSASYLDDVFSPPVEGERILMRMTREVVRVAQAVAGNADDGPELIGTSQGQRPGVIGELTS